MSRLSVKKTYKLYIAGKFPRTESGRSYPVTGKRDAFLANACRASRKDLRNAVVAAHKAQPGWAAASAYLRAQILYRLAEMLEGRSAAFADELNQQGLTPKQAAAEVAEAVDLLVYYAGWADKYAQLASTVNPVASPHFNFSRPEPTGVIGLVAPQDRQPLLGLIGGLAPILAAGNAVIALAHEASPLSAMSFAEVVNDSDVPGGVVNILTGSPAELREPFATHLDLNGLAWFGADAETRKTVGEGASLSVKRIQFYDTVAEDLDRVTAFTETKTTWHPVGA
ncbi:MAG: aldehyde dehydrogenase family protein [Opitutales bacterium]